MFFVLPVGMAANLARALSLCPCFFFFFFVEQFEATASLLRPRVCGGQMGGYQSICLPLSVMQRKASTTGSQDAVPYHEALHEAFRLSCISYAYWVEA